MLDVSAFPTRSTSRRVGTQSAQERLIEVSFPLKEVSLDSVHEKNVRHGHISTLHIWPARRPLAACRAALIATLLVDLGDAEHRRAIMERMAGRVVEKVERKRVNGRVVEKVKEETAGGILHWGRGERRGSAVVSGGDSQGLPRAGTESAGSVRWRRRDSPRRDASGVRRDRGRHQSGGVVHPQVHA